MKERKRKQTYSAVIQKHQQIIETREAVQEQTAHWTNKLALTKVSKRNKQKKEREKVQGKNSQMKDEAYKRTNKQHSKKTKQNKNKYQNRK